MNQSLFPTTPYSVISNRILYTPAPWAKHALLTLQEAGSLQAMHPHSSKREQLLSYLCFVVLSGTGSLDYAGKHYLLSAGDCVFLDCRNPYRHSTSEQLWTLQWCHFYGMALPAIYAKYQERGGQPVFHLDDTTPVTDLLQELYTLASSLDYIRDMKINAALNQLLTVLMSYSWHPEHAVTARKRMELDKVRAYLEEHYTENITLEELSGHFFINKYYLTKLFKEAYGITILTYLEQKRITQAKNLLRFTAMTMEEIGEAIGMKDANYFSRRFKKIEGMSPREYRKLW